MKKYESYKESGIDWVGEIPSHWIIKKIKHSTYVKGRIGWQNLRADDFRDEGPFLVTGTEFESGIVNWKDCHRVDIERYLMDPFIQLQENDVLITKDGTIGKIAIVKNMPDKATLNTGVFVTRPLNNLYNQEYMFWLLQSDVFKSFIDFNKTGATILHLYQNVFNEFSYPLPSNEEQNSIVSFLNAKTADINQLIQQKEALLEKLQQKRQAIINEAVTKGVNANVEMKDSGIEWLGQIPKHWEVKKLKYIKAPIPNSFVDGPFGSNLKSEHFIDNGDVLVVESGFVTSGRFVEKEFKTISFEHFKTISRSECKADDIIISKIGANFGMSGILPNLGKHAVVSGNSLKLTVDQEKFYNRFIHLSLSFLKKSGTFDLIVNATAQPALSLGALNDISIALPALNEQIEIVDFIDQQNERIDSISLILNEQIEKLKIFRQSLISEVVTGKVKVV